MSEIDRIQRERGFWDQGVASLEDCLAEFSRGPDPQTSVMIQAIGDVRDREVLDFACGVGVTSAWLAAGGARVTAIDLSPACIARCGELATHLGFGDRVRPVVGELTALPTSSFDAVVGRYALHHVDCDLVAPQMVALLRAGAVGAFVETFDSNPVLRVARRYLIGRFGVPRYGTIDEQPLRPSDVDAMREAFGSARTCVPRMAFLRILDRQVLKHRLHIVSRILGGVDNVLGRVDRLSFLSYHQVLVCGPLRADRHST